METKYNSEYYYKFCIETELTCKAKDLKRTLLILGSRMIAILLLWIFFVRPYLDTRFFELIVSLFIFIQFTAVIYPLYVERKARFRKGGPW